MATATDTDTRTSSRTSTETGLTLETPQGITTIADGVVAKLAGQAVREVTGVASMGKSFRRLLGRVSPGEESLTQGVNVEVGKKECAVDVVIMVMYGHPIPTLAQEVRENVIAQVENHTGLTVKEVNIEVDDMVFEDDAPNSSRVE